MGESARRTFEAVRLPTFRTVTATRTGYFACRDEGPRPEVDAAERRSRCSGARAREDPDDRGWKRRVRLFAMTVWLDHVQAVEAKEEETFAARPPDRSPDARAAIGDRSVSGVTGDSPRRARVGVERPQVRVGRRREADGQSGRDLPDERDATSVRRPARLRRDDAGDRQCPQDRPLQVGDLKTRNGARGHIGEPRAIGRERRKRAAGHDPPRTGADGDGAYCRTGVVRRIEELVARRPLEAGFLESVGRDPMRTGPVDCNRPDVGRAAAPVPRHERERGPVRRPGRLSLEREEVLGLRCEAPRSRPGRVGHVDLHRPGTVRASEEREPRSVRRPCRPFDRSARGQPARVRTVGVRGPHVATADEIEFGNVVFGGGGRGQRERQRCKTEHLRADRHAARPYDESVRILLPNMTESAKTD
jgi:hypothetical protein